MYTPTFVVLHTSSCVFDHRLFMAMAKEKESGEFLWATEVWHSRLLDFESKEGTSNGIFKRMFGASTKKTNPEQEHVHQ